MPVTPTSPLSAPDRSHRAPHGAHVSHAVSAGQQLLAPAVATGTLMAAYLLLRPYGDTSGSSGTTVSAAAAFASTWWVVAHVCGALAIASFGRLALRLADLERTRTASAARTTALAGTVLVLPYYGAETFGLHALGRAALRGDTAAMELVGEVRDQPAAMTMFVLGLTLLAVAGVLVGLVWQRRGGHLAWAAWPLGLAVASLAPQFYLPPQGRMLFGVGYAVAAALLAVAAWRSRRAGSSQR